MCKCSKKISTADTLVLGAMQILIGIFHIFMWYLLMVLYVGQIKGVFGTYEPITYKAGCPLWGIIFIITGSLLIRIAKKPSQHLVICALIFHILCMIATITAITLTGIELSNFPSVSYRNFGQAKLGRQVSRILMTSNQLEFSVALTYTIFSCIALYHGHEDILTSVTEEVESSF